MTHEEIAELFIHAAEVDRQLPNTSCPARLKVQALPYVHDHVDQAGWGGQRYEEERQAFWDARSTRLQVQDVNDWEKANDLIVHVQRERDRRCLWAWANSKAGGKSFSKWCRDVEHIHRNYGKECCDRAMHQISEHFVRIASLDVMGGVLAALQLEPEIEQFQVNIDEPRHFAWMAPGAFIAAAHIEARDFSWATEQNERRKQRDARPKSGGISISS
jgi:hypothetical protein